MRRAVSSTRTRIVLGVFAALVLGWSGSAAAEAKRVGVPRFDGPQEAVVRKAVIQALRGDGYQVVGPRELDGGAQSAGVQLDSNDGFKAVAKELSLSAFVTGEVAKKKAKLTVRNGGDGSVSGEGSFGGATPAKIAADIREGFSRRLGSAVERGRVPSGAKAPAAPVAAADEQPAGDEKPAADDGGEAPAKKAAANGDETPPAADTSGAAPEETVARKAPASGDQSGEVGPRALDIGVGFGGFSRSLTYNQDLYGALRQYKLSLGPQAVVSILLYPLGFVTSGFAANIGVEANIDQAFGVSSSVPANAAGSFPNGATFGAVIHDYYGGVRLRLVLNGGHELSLSGGGGEHAFSFRDGSGPDDLRMNLNIPDTIYHYLRIGANARFELGSGMVLGLAAGYRRVLNQGGQISDPGFFPYLTVAGVDADAMLGYHITPSIEARFDVNIRRYFYAMNSAPADFGVNSVAGGAVDQYVGFTVGAAYIFGGVAPGAVAAADEAPAEEAPKKHKHKKKKASDDDEDSSGGDDSGGGDNAGGGDADQ